MYCTMYYVLCTIDICIAKRKMQNNYNCTARIIVLHVSSYCFDISIGSLVLFTVAVAAITAATTVPVQCQLVVCRDACGQPFFKPRGHNPVAGFTRQCNACRLHARRQIAGSGSVSVAAPRRRLTDDDGAELRGQPQEGAEQRARGVQQRWQRAEERGGAELAEAPPVVVAHAAAEQPARRVSSKMGQPRSLEPAAGRARTACRETWHRARSWAVATGRRAFA